jgi:hypothetical protein
VASFGCFDQAQQIFAVFNGLTLQIRHGEHGEMNKYAIYAI